MDIILSNLVVSSWADNACKDDELSDERLEFKSDPIRAEVDSMGSVLDPEVSCDLLDDQIALSKFSGAVRRNT